VRLALLLTGTATTADEQLHDDIIDCDYIIR